MTDIYDNAYSPTNTYGRTVELLRDVFGVAALIDDHPLSGYPRITWITQA